MAAGSIPVIVVDHYVLVVSLAASDANPVYSLMKTFLIGIALACGFQSGNFWR